jgi:hypothetical protein
MNILTLLSLATTVSAFCQGRKEINFTAGLPYFFDLEKLLTQGVVCGIRAYCPTVEYFDGSQQIINSPRILLHEAKSPVSLNQTCDKIKSITAYRDYECVPGDTVITKIDGTQKYDDSTNTLQVFGTVKYPKPRAPPTPCNGMQECIIS